MKKHLPFYLLAALAVVHLTCTGTRKTESPIADENAFFPPYDSSLLAPPELLEPSDRRQFQLGEQQEVVFRWSPVTPALSKKVFYKITIWKENEVREGEQGFLRQTAVWSDSVQGTSLRLPAARLLPPRERSQRYVWEVLAVDERGVPVCGAGEGCRSGQGIFFLLLSDYHCQVLWSVTANCAKPAYDGSGNVMYDVTVVLDNQSLGTGSGVNLNFWKHPTPANQFAVFGGSVSNLSPAILPTTLTYTVPFTFTFTLTVPVGTPSFYFEAFMHSTDFSPTGNPMCEQTTPETVKLPPCLCPNPCVNKITWASAPSIVQSADPALSYDLLTVNDVVFVAPNPIIKVQAEIIGFQHQRFSRSCESCNRDNQSHAEFVVSSAPASCTLGGGGWQNSGAPVDYIDNLPLVGDSESRGICWVSFSAAGVSMFGGTPIHLKIGIPNLHPLPNCCRECFIVCVRYTFFDADCRVCEVVRTYVTCKTSPLQPPPCS